MAEITSAVKKGDLQQFHACIEKGCDVNERDKRGRTALYYAVMGCRADMVAALVVAAGARVNEGYERYLLHDAVRNGSADMVRTLVAAGCDVNERNPDGLTVLHTAMHEDKLDMVGALVAEHCDVNERDPDGRTALYYAANKNRPDIVNLLVAAGARVGDGDGFEILRVAVSYNRPKMVAVLVAAGARIDARDVNGRYMLHDAVKIGGADMVRSLVEAGCDVNEVVTNEQTVLHQAVMDNRVEMVRALIELGARINVVDTYGRDLIRIAVRNDNTAVICALAKAGARFDATDTEGHYLLLAAVNKDKPDMVSALVEAGARMDLRDREAYDLLHQTVRSKTGSTAMISALAAAGCDVNALDKEGRTALHYAVMEDNIDMVRALVEAGARIDVVDEHGRDLLHIAIRNERSVIVRVLVKAGAHFSVQEGPPMLREAVIEDRPYVVRALVAAGCDVNMRDDRGRTPLDYARQTGSRSVIRELSAAGATKETGIAETETGETSDGDGQLHLQSESEPAMSERGSDDVMSKASGARQIYLPSLPPESESESHVGTTTSGGEGAQIYTPFLPPDSVCDSDIGNNTRGEIVAQVYLPSEPPSSVSGSFAGDSNDDVYTSNPDLSEDEADQPEPDATELAVRDDTITITLSREDIIPILHSGGATPNPNPVALVRDTTGDMCHQLFDDGLVHVRNVHGDFIRDFVIRGPNGRRVRPTGMAVTPNGYFIAEQNHVFMCSHDGCFIHEIGHHITVTPGPDGGVHGLAYHDGRVYAATPHSIYVFNADDGNRIAELHNPANGPCDLDIFMSDDGLRIYLSDWSHDRVYVLDESGNVVNSFGDSGAGQLSHPKGISVSDDGYCYVADSQHGTVNVYTVSDGQLHHRIQADGRGFGRVIDVVAMADGTIIICTAEGLYVMRP